MRSIMCLNDLRSYGIVPLTGEADNLGFRILCDLTEQGRRIMCECFGLQPGGFSENWNGGGGTHVASIMIGNESLRAVGTIALFTLGAHSVAWPKDGGCVGFFGEEKFFQRYGHWEKGWIDEPIPEYGTPAYDEKKYHWIYQGENGDLHHDMHGEIQRLVRPLNSHPHQGTRNTHAMSGRTV